MLETENRLAALELGNELRTLSSFQSDSYAPRANQSLKTFVEAHRTAGNAHLTLPFPDNLIAGKNTYAYDAHTYHTKVPPEAIERLIEHYTQPGDLVLDPFCGSGMTGVASLRTGRKPILIDLSPAATFIALNFLAPVSARTYIATIEKALTFTREEEMVLYGTHCRDCG